MSAARWAVTGLLAPLFLLALPLSAAQEEPWKMEDDVGDADMGPFPGIQSTPLTNSADLVGIQIDGENEDGFFLSLLVDGYRVATTETGGLASQYNFYGVSFKASTTGVRYDVRIAAFGYFADDPGLTDSTFVASQTYASICPQEEDADCVEDVVVEMIDSADAFRVWVPKETFATSSGSVSRGVTVVRVGDQLTDFRAWSYSYNTVLGQVASPSDWMPNVPSTDAYTFRTGAANGVIRARLPSTEGSLPVATATNQSVKFLLQNGAAARRFIQLTYEIEGSPEAVGRYAVVGPATINLPGGQARNLTLALQVAPDASLADDVRLTVRGVARGHPEEVAYASVRLDPVAPLTPEANKLYFHGLDHAKLGSDVADPVVCALPQNDGVLCHDGFLSPLSEEPAASDSGRVQGSREDLAGGTLRFDLGGSYALPIAAAFQPQRPVEVDVRLTAPVDVADVEVRALFVAYAPGGQGKQGGPQILVRAERTTSVSASGTTLTFSGLPALPSSTLGTYLPQGTRFYFTLWAKSLGPQGLASFGLRALEIDARTSHATLPLMELPPALRPNANDAPFLLSVTGSPEDYVNPGKTHAYNVTAVNQAPEPRRLGLSTTLDGPLGWDVELRPGATFDLAPGDGIVVGVLVTAPANSAEGDTARVWLNATSDAGAVSSVLLATTAIELAQDDGAAGYVQDDEAASKLVVTKGKETPTAPLALLLVTVACLGLALRRRDA